MAPERCNLFLIYGSQTGQSKSIAEDIKTKAESFNYDVEMMSMDESVEKVLLSDCLHVLLQNCICLLLTISDAMERI